MISGTSDCCCPLSQQDVAAQDRGQSNKSVRASNGKDGAARHGGRTLYIRLRQRQKPKLEDLETKLQEPTKRKSTNKISCASLSRARVCATSAEQESACSVRVQPNWRQTWCANHSPTMVRSRAGWRCGSRRGSRRGWKQRTGSWTARP